VERRRRAQRAALAEPLPLTMPAELWLALAPEKRRLFTSAQAILDDLTAADGSSLTELCERMGRSVKELIAPLKLLRRLELIEVGPGPMLRVIAVPAEPLHVRGPDGRWRWIFVRRRLVRDLDLERATWN
jgi:predicted transcriptional regulator